MRPYLRSLVTVGNRDYYVSLYEGRLNSIENAIVLICYPKEHFGNQATLKAFLCTDVSLLLEEILSIYTERWSIEIFFRDTKGKLALDQYQIRSSQGIQRYWMLMSFVHFLCCTGTGKMLISKLEEVFYKEKYIVRKSNFSLSVVQKV